MKTKMKNFYNKTKSARKFLLISLCMMLTGTSCIKANNLSISGLTATDNATYYTVTFLISWDNSWYASAAPNNWDAVWVFVKYKDCSVTNWSHANLDPAGHSVSGGVLTVETVGDNMGAFIHRAAAGGPGNIPSASVTLKLSTITPPLPPGGPFNFQVFGIEMVKILAEDFQIGDATSSSTFTSRTITTAEEAAGVAANWTLAASPAVPAAYPMGWDAMYCMKYEITNEQYVDFLNTLTYTQQVSRTAIAPNSAPTNFAMYSSASIYARNSIKIKTSGVSATTPAEYACDFDVDNNYDETSDGQNIAMSYLGWYDLEAYLDWAALRPMSDLEFEKICRGPVARVAGEYVWGSSTAILQTTFWSSQVSNSGFADEISTTSGNGLCAYAGCCATTQPGPYRVGFAATTLTDRVKAGATYYGVMEMGGNLWERVVSVLTNGVDVFTGTLGNGALDASGNATNADWPTNAATSIGYRGGYWMGGSGNVRTSDRQFASTVDVTRTGAFGGRGVR